MLVLDMVAMKQGGIKLKPDEIAKAFSGPGGERFPPTLSAAQAAAMFGLSVKTIYDWKTKNRLNGTFRKRGKHLVFWRDRLINVIMNGKEWPSEKSKGDDTSCGQDKTLHSRQEEDLDS